MDSLKEKLVKYCTYQDRCHSDVEKKIYSLGRVSPSEKEELLYYLIKNKFLNEERFTINYCLSKFKYNKWGRNKIRMELKQKRIESQLIEKGLEAIDEEDYYQVASELIEKKKEQLNSKKLSSFELNKKVSAYLATKGFEFELIKEFLNY